MTMPWHGLAYETVEMLPMQPQFELGVQLQPGPQSQFDAQPATIVVGAHPLFPHIEPQFVAQQLRRFRKPNIPVRQHVVEQQWLAQFVAQGVAHVEAQAVSQVLQSVMQGDSQQGLQLVGRAQATIRVGWRHWVYVVVQQFRRRRS